MAAVVGGTTGLAAIGLDLAVRHAHSWLTTLPASSGIGGGRAALAAAPVLGGLLIAWIVVRAAPHVRGSGIPSVMAAVANRGGRMPPSLLLWRPLATVLSIGSGASLGTEGPVIQLGATLASVLCAPVRATARRRRTLVAVATAAGIAATFNAPIAGVLFSLEAIETQMRGDHLAALAVGAATASAVSRSLLGAVPAFKVPALGPGPLVDLPAFLVLGLVCGLSSVLLGRALSGSEDLLDRLPLAAGLRPAAGGAVVGLLSLAAPQVLGRGYHVVGDILQGGGGGVAVLLGLALAKVVATAASFGSWGAGGVFAPALFLGAALGSAFGRVAAPLVSAAHPAAGAFALVGMAAALAALTRTPLTAVVLVLEMSGGTGLILPLLLATAVAVSVAAALGQASIYHVILSRRGRVLVGGREVDPLRTVAVRDLLEPDVAWLERDATLDDFATRVAHDGVERVLLRDSSGGSAGGGGLAGAVTLADLERARRDGLGGETRLADVARADVPTALPGETAGAALERMARLDVAFLPVVAPDDPTRVLGVLDQRDLARGYYRASERSDASRAGPPTRLRDVVGERIVEVRVRSGSPLAGSTLAQAELPPTSVVVALRRGGRTIVPRGASTLHPGDLVVAAVEPGHGAELRRRFRPVRGA